MSAAMQRRRMPATLACAALVLAGCAAPDVDTAVGDAARLASPVATDAAVRLELTETQRAASARQVQAMLAHPLSADGAAQVALANSPAFQAALAAGWGELAAAIQHGAPGNPVLTFERLREGPSLELGRLLSVGLVDLLMLPQRRALARTASAQARVGMAAAIVDEASAARQAWVKAVAAREVEKYAQQVQEAADASAELARRMQQAGNFSKLQAARQHLFYADATAGLATARQAAVASREALVRRLGLTDGQAQQLKLPERLPDLPASPLSAADVSRAATQQRLDLRMAQLALEAASQGRSTEWLAAVANADLGGRRDTHFDGAGGKSTARGIELEIRLPVFDTGSARRAGLDAQALAAAQRLEAARRAATSQLRESYAAYRTAFELARHQRDEVVPLRKTISEENVLRYNGMLIGVFELLADARGQVAGVITAIEAQRDFWLADAALAANLVGRPTPAPATRSTPTTAPSTDAGH